MVISVENSCPFSDPSLLGLTARSLSLNSSLEFIATYDGAYYASAASYGDYYTGNYSILATKINESNWQNIWF